jgi:hypothetical protein
MIQEVSQGRFHVERDLSGRVVIEMPPVVIVPADVAIEMARAILTIAGVEVLFADPGQTVIRGGNGNGKIIR